MTGAKKILLVDDEPEVTKAIGRVLTREGYEVIQVNEPAKVEDYILYTELAAVITDLKMPNIDGFEVLKLVRKSKPSLPVLMLTGFGSIDTAVAATKLGAAEFLSKPVVNHDLITAIKKHTEAECSLPDRIRNMVASPVFQSRSKDKGEDEKILLDDEIVSTDSIPDGFVEVRFEDMVPGEKLPFNLYVQIFNRKTEKHYLRLICRSDQIFTSGLRNILFRRQLGSLFIKEQDYRKYLAYYTALKSMPGFKTARIRERKKLVLYGKAVEAIADILARPIDEKVIQSAVNLVDSIFTTMVKDPELYQDMFKLFRQDTSIFNHSANVCLLSVSFGMFLRLDKSIVHTLGLGALFHDLGMNKIDREILLKETPLTQEEWLEIKNHPEKGHEQLKRSLLFPRDALRIVLEHHEESDGSGYPRGLKADEISTMTKICRIIDRFDSMTTAQPYRAAFSPAEALKTIYLDESSEKARKLIRHFIEFLGGKKEQP